MTDAELALRLRETLSAAQRRYRTARGMGCIVTPKIPDGLLDEVAAGLAPVLRALVADAVAQQDAARRAEHLDGLVREAAAMGLYESTATPKDTR